MRAVRLLLNPLARGFAPAVLAAALFAGRAGAQVPAEHLAIPVGGAAAGAEHGSAAAGTEHGGAAVAAEHGGAAAAGAEHGGHPTGAAHAKHAEHDESAPPGPINWWHGLFGTTEGEPSILFRTKDEPPPFLATVINFAALAFLFVKFGRGSLAKALTDRKRSITQDMDDAGRMKAEAEKRLGEYERRLAEIESDVERVHHEFREQGERDRERIVAEAHERRERLKRDAEFFLAQELKQMRIDLTRETVDDAVRQASELLEKRITSADHERFAETFLAQVSGAGPGSASTPPAKGPLS